MKAITLAKTAIRYIRISTDKQSNYSIAGQNDQTSLWCQRNNVDIIDTFIDEGYSARNFDRPDMNRLNDFISKHHRSVDYLVVFDFTRFSRDAGEAIVVIKRLQQKYAIRIASSSENTIVDYDEPGSFFFAGLRFLQAEDEIIRNKSRINLGIYTAKKKEGRYLGKPPVGYLTKRDGNKTIIVVDEEKAPIIRYIYEAFLQRTPTYVIAEKAREMGLTHTYHMRIQWILKNPVYTGLLLVKAYKENPEELVDGNHEPIISRSDWNRVQDKMKPGKPKIILSDHFPLRGIVKCHCGKPLTGAPSRSRSGKYID
jgi:site-specific DNA recombinase